ncbi:MAG TPA: type I methionyl aminopeptidase [Bdellovibrionota bacterium]|nr:type I methionyl aminopeptidase [Bdellovibrionota bacterium]
MIVIKTREDVETMKPSCSLVSDTLDFIEDHIKAGVSTEALDKLCHDFIVNRGAVPSPLNYKGYPKSICTSINNVVCHGIPNDHERLRDGDIINVDVSAFLNNFHGDSSRTYMVGKCSRAARELVQATYEAMWKGIEAIRPGGHFGDIGYAIQSFAEAKGYSVVREYCGHGIGRTFHEDPHVTHYGRRGTGERIRPGMVFTVEPMINQGKRDVDLLDDDWTAITVDGKLSAQFEHTVAVWEDRLEILTIGAREDAPRELRF